MKLSLIQPTFSQLFYKLPPFFLFAFVIFQCVAPTSVLGSVHHLGNETDHAALLAIKSQLVGRPDGVLSSWNHSLHHCYWDGVICGRKHNRVIKLHLGSSGLVGSISPFIGNLSFLKDIALYNNSLSGQIPPELGRLFSLKALGLHNNTLTGEIPANLSACINLQGIAIEFNKLVGELPVEFRALSKLTGISLHFNSLTGPIFDVISNITSLEKISATGNAFTGSIPSSIGKMLNLNTLYVGQNELTGTIPTSILNCSMLEMISFGYNKLDGELPPNIGLRLPHLVILDFSFNQFSGAIPTSVFNLTSIEDLVLGVNNFRGRISSNFGGLRNLSFLDLDDNNLEGDINFVGTLVNCSKLEIMEVGGNKFTGILPKSIANLSTSLRQFSVDRNKIRGEIPNGIFNLINLELLTLNNNELTGSISHEFEKLHKLEILYLYSNNLEGNIPDCFGNLSYLSSVVLRDNQLQGRIPSSLGSCSNLLSLDLSSNHLNGTLIKELFKGSAMFIGIVLHDNLLEGFIPLEISIQTNLVQLSLSQNKLSGTIPDGLSHCQGLTSLDMYGNFLTGYIPSSFTSLGSLQIVDLSRNNLSGTIPSYFSKFPLQLLNLSYNNFEGEVPTKGVFSNISAIELDGNIKLCGGIPKLHLARCRPHKEKGKMGKVSHAFKLIVSILCTLFGVLIVAIWLYLICHKKRRAPITSGSTKESFINVSYNKLLKATNGFSVENLIGAGNFGYVFRGKLDGEEVAVKVLNLQTREASKSFVAECKALQNVRHRNLVGIITVCSSIDFQRNDFRALVYKFMPNGNLDRWLHGDGAEKLSLVQRVDIAIDVAQAIIYLHDDCETPIVHCDLKPSNILLDNDMVAHVGDFGLAKFVGQPRHPNQSSSIGILGTIGYVAPEYGLGCEPSPIGDLYSYGILVLELVTGKRPTDKIFQEGFTLQLYAEEGLSHNVLQIVDPTLENDEMTEEIDNIRTNQTIVQQQIECMVSLISVGIECSKHSPQDRMNINDAIKKLQVARDHLCKATQRRNFQRDTIKKSLSLY